MCYQHAQLHCTYFGQTFVAISIAVSLPIMAATTHTHFVPVMDKRLVSCDYGDCLILNIGHTQPSYDYAMIIPSYDYANIKIKHQLVKLKQLPVETRMKTSLSVVQVNLP